uniref:tRNA-specific adenosine deaminase 2 n=1 Tax=Cacopsylla melanoneura TaxID=428564 RepID=A0A8D8Y655_9HEMI
MNIATIEHWVLKSMTEAQDSLQNGEVPVGCLFVIRHEILDDILKTKGKVSEENAVFNRESTQCEFDNKTTRWEKGNIDNTSIVKEFTHDNSSAKPSDWEKQDTENTYEDTKDKSELNPEFVSHAKDTSETGEYPDTSGNYIVIARGKNEVNATKNATRHAELVCIDQVVTKYAETYRKVFENVTVIVNVEPCIMCMAALLELNIDEIVFTCVNDRFGYNILGRTDRTNYVAIVELNMLSSSSDGCFKDVVRGNEEKGKRLAVDSENAVETIEEIETDLVRTDNVGENSVETDQVISEDGDTIKTHEDTEMKNLENIVMKTDVDTESNTREQNVDKFSKTKRYKISFLDQNQRNQNLIVNQTECIANKISCIQQDRKQESELFREQTFPSEECSFRAEPIRRNRRCNVFHYRKYESATMDILKLFYKGVNPNAPKHKVKNKS